MATNSTLKNQLQQKGNNAPSQVLTLKGLMGNETVKQKFNNVLGEKAPGFTTSLLNMVGTSKVLAECDPNTVMTSAMVAATFDLPVDPNLGFFYIVPFNNKKKMPDGSFQWVKEATPLLGYKGYIQLAQRSGQYKKLNVITVYEGELVKWDRLTEEYELDFEKKLSDKAVGYLGYFELLNGYKKATYWTKSQVETHRIKHNKGKDKSALTGVWRSDYDAMATKTVLRNLLSKWGPLSIIQQAASLDESTVKETNGYLERDPDSRREAEVVEEDETTTNIPIDPVTGEVIYPEENNEQENLFEGRTINPKEEK